MNNQFGEFPKSTATRYVPTKEDLQNDILTEQWKAQRREESRQHYLRYQANKTRSNF